MPEIPTYRVTGEDWDPPIRAQREPLQPEPRQDGQAVPPERPPFEAVLSPAVQATALPAQPAPRSDSVPDGSARPPAPLRAVTSGGGAVAAFAHSGAVSLTARVAPSLVPAVERVPPRLLLVAIGTVVGAIVLLMLLGSGRPAGLVAVATAEPSAVAPVATPACRPIGTEVLAPVLVVEPRAGEARSLFGVPGPESPPDLDGPWAAELGPEEGSVALGSTLRLTSGSACIREWRAVAAHPPATTGSPWRPDEPDTFELGWQKADRVRWEPTVPLPPRGEWVVRLTVWYRDPAAAALGPDGSPVPAPDVVAERYFRLSVVAPE